MRLRKVSPDWANQAFDGDYRGYHVRIERLGHAHWAARINGSYQRFESLAQARRECQHAIDYAARDTSAE